MHRREEPALKVGERVARVGCAVEGKRGEAVLRVERLFVGDEACGLRSSQALARGPRLTASAAWRAR